MSAATSATAPGAEGRVQGVGGDGHVGFLVPQGVDESGDDVAAGRGVGLDLGPVRRDGTRRLGTGAGQHLLDPGQRHPHQPERRHQARTLELLGGVPAVARVLVDLDRAQQPELVVETQRLRRQARGAGEVADRHQVTGAGHRRHPLR
jgi:hypothetical protein